MWTPRPYPGPYDRDVRLLPEIAVTGPWYAVYPIRLVYAVAFFFALFWPYVLLPDARPDSWGSALGPVVGTPAFFLVQRRQIERRAGRSLERCREVIRRVRRGEPPADPTELAAVIEAVRPQLRTGGTRWVLPIGLLLVAAVNGGIHARHVTGALVFATAWVVLAAAVLFVVSTRSERRDRELLARLDAALAG